MPTVCSEDRSLPGYNPELAIFHEGRFADLSLMIRLATHEKVEGGAAGRTFLKVRCDSTQLPEKCPQWI
jgi:hypothetical protein